MPAAPPRAAGTRTSPLEPPVTGHCTTCPRAHTPAEQDRHCCNACIYRMRTWLAELPGELAQLDDLLEPGARPKQGSIHGSRTNAPAPARLDVLNLVGPGAYLPKTDPYGDQEDTPPPHVLLPAWARYIASQYPVRWTDKNGTVHTGPRDVEPEYRHGGTALQACCAWLAGYIPYAAGYEWIHQLYAELQELMIRVRDITQSQIRTLLMKAPCPLCKTFALVAKDGEFYIECQACPEVLDREYYFEEYEPQALAQIARDALAQHAAKAAADAARDQAEQADRTKEAVADAAA